MGAKVESKFKSSPGPGNYNPDGHVIYKTASNFSVGKDKRHLLKELNKFPGPGQHEASSQLGGPKFGFGSSTRSPFKPSTDPGPGHYDFTVQVGNAADFSLLNPNYKGK